jgi:hypothetical protein
LENPGPDDGKQTIVMIAGVFLGLLVFVTLLRPELWYVLPLLLAGLVAFVIIVVAAGRLWEGLRRCPRCGRRGFVSILDSEKGSPEGDLFYQVVRCQHCDLYRLECGAEVRELDPELWWEQVQEWENSPT